MNDDYKLLYPKEVFIGANVISKLEEILEYFQGNNLLIVTDKGINDAGLLKKLLEYVDESKINTKVLDTVPREPDIKTIEIMISEAKKSNPDVIIGIGGGSALDTAKIIAAMVVNEGSLKEVLGTDLIKKSGVPKILIPTTAGTGSEATPNAIVTLLDEDRKIGIVSRYLMADYVFLDPTMTLSLPKHITAFTGMDAFAHAIECYTSKKANSFSDMLALEAMKLINENIEKAYTDGSNVKARENMLYASYLAGLCISSSSTTAVHALAYPLGGKYHIPHGVANAMLLPYVMDFNKEEIEEKFQNIAKVLNLKDGAKVVERLYELNKNLNIPATFLEYGIEDVDIDNIVESALKVTRLLDNNPRKMIRNDVYKIYNKLL